MSKRSAATSHTGGLQIGKSAATTTASLTTAVKQEADEKISYRKSLRPRAKPVDYRDNIRQYSSKAQSSKLTSGSSSARGDNTEIPTAAKRHCPDGSSRKNQTSEHSEKIVKGSTAGRKKKSSSASGRDWGPFIQPHQSSESEEEEEDTAIEEQVAAKSRRTGQTRPASRFNHKHHHQQQQRNITTTSSFAHHPTTTTTAREADTNAQLEPALGGGGEASSNQQQVSAQPKGRGKKAIHQAAPYQDQPEDLSVKSGPPSASGKGKKRPAIQQQQQAVQHNAEAYHSSKTGSCASTRCRKASRSKRNQQSGRQSEQELQATAPPTQQQQQQTAAHQSSRRQQQIPTQQQQASSSSSAQQRPLHLATAAGGGRHHNAKTSSASALTGGDAETTYLVPAHYAAATGGATGGYETQLSAAVAAGGSEMAQFLVRQTTTQAAAASSASASGGTDSDHDESEMSRLQALLEARNMPIPATALLNNLAPRIQQMLHRPPTSTASSKATQLIEVMKSNDESRQLQAVIEMCQILVMGNEDTLTGFPIRSAVPVLINLLKIEHNFDMMVNACRAISYMMEALPRSSTVIVQAVPVLLQKLQSIQCMDVAEQSLSALEQLSRQHSASILTHDGFNASLLFLDFFSLQAQRNALKVAANCCCVSPTSSAVTSSMSSNEEFQKFFASSIPMLVQKLSHHDKRCLESICLCFARIVDQYHSDVATLKQLGDYQLLQNFQNLLVVTPPLIGSHTFVMVIKTMYQICSPCPHLANTLIENNIADTLQCLLCGSSSSSGGGGEKRNEEDDEEKDAPPPVILPRSPQELFEITALIRDLMPKLPTDEVVFGVDLLLQTANPANNSASSQRSNMLGGKNVWQWQDDSGEWRNYSKADCRKIEVVRLSHRADCNLLINGRPYTIDFTIMQQINDDSGVARPVRKIADTNALNNQQPSQSEKGCELRRSRKDLSEKDETMISQLVRSLSKLLYEVFIQSAGSPPVRHNCVHALKKMIYYAQPQLLDKVIDGIKISSNLTSMLSSSSLEMIAAALQISILLIEKLFHKFQSLFVRQGVVYQVAKLLDPNNKTVCDTPPEPAATSSAPVTSSSTSLLGGAGSSSTTQHPMLSPSSLEAAAVAAASSPFAASSLEMLKHQHRNTSSPSSSSALAAATSSLERFAELIAARHESATPPSSSSSAKPRRSGIRISSKKKSSSAQQQQQLRPAAAAVGASSSSEAVASTRSSRSNKSGGASASSSSSAVASSTSNERVLSPPLTKSKTSQPANPTTSSTAAASKSSKSSSSKSGAASFLGSIHPPWSKMLSSSSTSSSTLQPMFPLPASATASAAAGSSSALPYTPRNKSAAASYAHQLKRYPMAAYHQHHHKFNSAATSSATARRNEAERKVKSWIREQANELLSKYFPNFLPSSEEASSKQSGGDVKMMMMVDDNNDLLSQLTTVARLIDSCKDMDDCAESMKRLRDVVTSSDASPFELQHSGVIGALLRFLTTPPPQQQQQTNTSGRTTRRNLRRHDDNNNNDAADVTSTASALDDDTPTSSAATSSQESLASAASSLSDGKSQPKVVHSVPQWQRLRCFLHVFADLPMDEFSAEAVDLKSVTEKEGGAIRKLEGLVGKLNMCVSQLEQLPVNLHHVSAVGNRSEALSYFTRNQLKCHLQRHPQSPKLKQWPGGAVRVDPLAMVSAIEKYLTNRGYSVLSTTSSTPGASGGGGNENPSSRNLPSQMDDDDSDDDDEIDESYEQGASSAGTTPNSKQPQQRGSNVTSPASTSSSATSHNHQQQQAQHRLELSINGHTLSSNMTVYQAVKTFSSSSTNQQQRSYHHGNASTLDSSGALWSSTHVIHYKHVPLDASKSASGKAGKSSKRGSPKHNNQQHRNNFSWSSGRIQWRPTLIDRYTQQPSTDEQQAEATTELDSDPAREVLALLKVIYGLSKHWHMLYTATTVTTTRPLLPPTSFIIAKLSGKCARQVQDPLMIMTGEIPSWVGALARRFPFLLPFDTRQIVFRMVAFDRDRAIHYLIDSGRMAELNQQAGANSSASSGGSASASGGGGGSSSASYHHHHHDSTSRFTSSKVDKKKYVVKRENLLAQAEKLMHDHAHQRHIIEVQYEGEVGTGLGPTHEFYTLAGDHLQRANLLLWRSSDDHHHNHDDSDVIKKVEGESRGAYVHSSTGLFPRPLSKSARSHKSNLNKFRFIGRLLAKSLMDNRLVDLPLSRVFYKWLLGAESAISYHDLEQVDQQMSMTYFKLMSVYHQREVFTQQNRQKLASATTTSANVADDQDSQSSNTTTEVVDVEEYWGERERQKSLLTVDGCRVDDLALDFQLPGFPDIEMMRNGSNVQVSLDNIDKYLTLIAYWTLHEGVRHQMEAVRSGFNSVLPLTSLHYFYPEELDELFCGARFRQWTIEELADACRTDHGYTLESATVKNLFAMLAKYDCEQQRKFLQFVTGSPHLPIGGVRAMNPRLTIVRSKSRSTDDNNQQQQDKAEDPDQYLPSVMTCVNYLKVPDYSSAEVLEARFEKALHLGQHSFLLS